MGSSASLALLLIGVASMAVYAMKGHRRDTDQESKGARFFMGFGDFLLHWFMWVIGPAVELSLKAGLTPGFYNYLGLALGFASGVLIALGHLELGGWSIALGGVCDILDGRIARATGVASDYGDFIDSTFDRFGEVFAFLGFAVYLRATPYGPFLASSAMAASLVVSYARARGEVLGVLCTGGLMQRGERLAVTCIVCLADPPLTSLFGWAPGTLVQWMLAFIALTTTLTAIHRTFWISSRLRPAPGNEAAPPSTDGDTSSIIGTLGAEQEKL